MTSAQTTPLLEGYLTRRQLAAELGRTTRTLDRLHAARAGPPRLKIGKLILYRRDDVRAWLDAQSARR